jgi:hypothetical protein
MVAVIFFFLLFLPLTVFLSIIAAGIGFHFAERIVKVIKEKMDEISNR